jgi:hypothetical protein
MTEPGRRTDVRAGDPPRALTAGVLALMAAVLAAWAVAVIGETSVRAFTSYTRVEAIVVDERTEDRLVADRRGSTRVPGRVVTVELPDGARADLRSDDLVVGAAVTVVRSDAGTVFGAPPPRPGPLEWGLSTAIVAGAVTLAAVSVRSVVRLRPSPRPGPEA